MCGKLSDKLENFYGKTIRVYQVSSKNKVQEHISDDADTIEIVVMIHNQLNCCLIWDIKHRKDKGWKGCTVSYNKKWSELHFEENKIYSHYKYFLAGNNWCYEKILSMNRETLLKVIFNLPDLLQFDSQDDDYPKELKGKDQEKTKDNSRNRITTSRWNRNQKFRNKILVAYGNQCAICRCKEEKILQAAHIIPVEDGGSDDVDNGICLCANHHLMFDNDLIEIDFTSYTLKYIADSVKQMSWYKDFVTIYNEELSKPII